MQALRQPLQTAVLRSTRPFFTPLRHFSSTPPRTHLTQLKSQTQQLRSSKPAQFPAPIHTAFRPSRVLLDWHQKVDNKTGKFYYVDVFTGQRTDVQPKMFLPYDAPKESAAMSILRHDRVDAQGVQSKKSVLRPLFTVALIAGGLYVAGEMGWLDSLFGYTPPPKQAITVDQKVIDRANQNMKNFLDQQRV